MNKKMTPKDKLSKKDKARLDRQRRVTWAFSPVSRVKKSKKCYRRADAKQQIREED